MSTTGEKYPSYGETVAETPYDDNAWTTPEYVTADDGNTANVTSANYDTDDYTQVLKAYTFDFSGIPSGATIDGVICRINCWYANGTADIALVQLLDISRAKGGDNKASTPVAMSTDTGTVETFGGAADKWGLSLTEAWVKDADFGVAISMQATQDSADVFVDYVTLEVYYTEAGGVQVTPAPAIAEGSCVSPGLVLGSITLAPALVEAVASALGATAVLGSIILTPAVANAEASALDPVVGIGGVYVTPGVAEALASVLPPSVVMDSVSVTPAQAIALALAMNPNVLEGEPELARWVCMNLLTLGVGGRRT